MNAAWTDGNERHIRTMVERVVARLRRCADGDAARDDPGAPEPSLDPPPAMESVVRTFSLSAFEEQVLWLCVTVEVDTGAAALCARAVDDPQSAHPSFAVALKAFEDLESRTWAAMSPAAPLRFWRLVEVRSDALPLLTAPIAVDERILSFIRGIAHPDGRLMPCLSPFDVPAGEEYASASQGALARSIAERVRTASAAGTQGPVVELLGPDPESKQIVALAAARELGLPLSRVRPELLPADPGEFDVVLRAWQRESLLDPAAIYLDVPEGDAGDPRSAAMRLLTAPQFNVLFAGAAESAPHLPTPIRVEAPRPSAAEQREAWRRAGPEARDAPARLAMHFDLNLHVIARVVAGTGGAGTDPLRDRLWDGCRAAARPRIGSLAQRVVPVANWDQIVLPEEQSALLRSLADQVVQRTRVYEEWGFAARLGRGLGITALFTGESGTGKTMAAEVIANQLRLDLYRIDLSSVVSKYIGETEKNLRRLFDAAESSGTLLFFDEADALFGKRSEVKDSHDRYANIEVNYLLQRMEAFSGLAILATNRRSALDHAFLRRLRFIIDFPVPGPAERRRIWRSAFPPQVPLAALDLDRLARLTLTGGSIRNVALNATFLAAAEVGPVTMQLILTAARTEFRKLQLPITDDDQFRWAEPEEIAA